MQNVMVKRPQLNTARVPDGVYPATLSAIRLYRNGYGDRVGFEFVLHGRQVEGLTVMRSCSPALSKKSRLTDILTGLLGTELSIDEVREAYDPEKLIGTDCMVLVLQAHDLMGHRYSNVEKVYQSRPTAD